MATATKHIERSRRSHKVNSSIFNDFHRNAYKVRNAKEQRKTFGEIMASALKKMMPKTTNK